MEIVSDKISKSRLKELAQSTFGDMIKAVVDINQEILAVDAELHSDLEAKLLENGSKQADLWGINLYPDSQGDDFVEFDSMINVRPSQGNSSRDIKDASLKEKIINLVNLRVGS